MLKFTIMKQNVNVTAMNDEERHLLEYRKYEKELNNAIPLEVDKQIVFWLQNRLKSVERRILDLTDTHD